MRIVALRRKAAIKAALALVWASPAAVAQPLTSVPASAPPARGYHLGVSSYGSPVLVVESLAGGMVHAWSAPSGWVFKEMAKPLSSGHVLAVIAHPASKRKKLVELDWSGNMVWEYEPAAGRTLHHEFTRLASGETLVASNELVSVPSLAPIPVSDELVSLIDPQGQTVWEWSSAAHHTQMPITQAGWSSLIPAGAEQATLFHLNSAEVLPPNRWEATDPRFSAGNVMVSYRELNLVVIIDRMTSDIVWYMHDVTIGQHHVRMLPQDYVGAGNLLMFDNGGSAGAPRLPYRPWSRAVEIDPTTLNFVWSYGGVPGQELFSQFMGSVQRLPNGNTVITEATSGRVFEITPARRIVWTRNNGRTYRTYRVPLAWPSGPIAPFRW